jgi:uncharacterized membrane protein
MTNDPQINFQQGSVEPMECLKGGWNLVKDQYWLFVGMCAVGMIIGSAVPLGILMGPMMCGIFLALFSKRRGLPIEFGTLFKGFDYFGQSVVAALLHVLPITAVIIFAYILMYVGMFAAMFATAAAGEDAAPLAGIGFVLMFLLFYCAILLVVIVISIGFTFAYPLIVDRKLQGFDAVKLSFRAAFSNFWRLLGLNLLGGLLSIGGVLLCYVGIILVFPITLGAAAVAYEQVFGLSRPEEMVSNLPPPPPTF